ncbi:nSTAND1 domain-containing NTPase [Streptomyces mirabilis]
MGRQEGELDPGAGPVQQFAFELRKLRQEAGGITYRAMARGTGYSLTTLSRAAAGEQLPSLPVTLAYVAACGGDGEEWERRWRAADAETTAAAVAADDSDPPYQGLARFEPGDRERYFGRERLAGEALALVRAHRFSAVFGPSGSGKSSLLRAGLIPALQNEPSTHLRPAAIRILTPGPHPARTHAGLFAPKDGTGETVVVIDQFEEVFTLCTDPAERKAFIDLALTALQPGSRLRVVLAVRADFYGRCAEYDALAQALGTTSLLVGPMNPAELREAIVRPAMASGLIVEQALTARIVEEVTGEPGGLPLMAHALLETWHRRKGRTLGEAAYDAVGGIHGAITRTAEDVYTQLTSAQADIARRILLRLITPGEGAQDTRRPVTRAELDTDQPDDTAVVLERLARARLVTLDDDSVDLAHEALITAWPRLHAWIDTGRERLRTHRKLTEATTAWDDLGRDPGALYRGTRLVLAEEQFAGAPADLTALEREFLTESTAGRSRERSRRRTFVATLSVLLALALVAGVVAWQQNRTSDRRSTEAAARRVAAVAENLRYSDPVTAMRLSVAAWRTADTTETRSALMGAATQREEDRFAPAGADPAGQLLLSDDGRVLVQAADKQVMTWDVPSHRKTGRFRGLGSGKWLVNALSPDGRRLALTADDGLVLWDVEKGRQIGDPLTSQVTTMIAAFGPSGHTLLADDGTDSGTVTVRLWDLDRRRTLFSHRVPRFFSAAVSRDDRLVGLCPSDGRVQLWGVAGHRGLALDKAPVVRTADQCAVTFSPDSRRVTIAAGEFVSTWDTTTGKLINQFPDAEFTDLQYSGDGKFLVAAGQKGIQIWRSSADGPVFDYPTTGDSVSDFRLDPGGQFIRYIADTATDTTTGKVVRTVTLGDLTRLSWQAEPLDGAWFSPDGRTLATARMPNEQKRIRFVDARSGRGTSRPPGTATCPNTSTQDGKGDETLLEGCTGFMTFSSDGRIAAYTLDSAGEPESRQRVLLWHGAGKPAALTLRIRPAASVQQIALSPDGMTLISLLSDVAGKQRVEVWDLRTRSRTRVINGIGGGSLAVRPDGRRLVTSDALFAELPSGRVGRLPLGFDTPDTLTSGGVDSSPPAQNTVEQIAFSADGRYLAVGDGSGRVTLLDGNLKKRLGVISGLFTSQRQDSAAPVTALAFSHDGRTLAVAGRDGTLRLWDVAANQPLGSTLPAPADPIQALVFSPDSGTLYAASDHVPSQAYQVSPGSMAAAVCKRARGGPSGREWEELIPEVPYRKVC